MYMYATSEDSGDTAWIFRFFSKLVALALLNRDG